MSRPGRLLLEHLQRRVGVLQQFLVCRQPHLDDPLQYVLVRIIEVVARRPAAENRGVWIEGGGIDKHLRAGHTLPDLQIERNPQRHSLDSARNKRRCRVRHALVDDLHILFGVDAVGPQGSVEEHMGGRSERRCDLFALEIGEGSHPHVWIDPELGRREFDAVDEEGLALATRREVGDDRAGGQHVDRPADHCLEDLKSGVELREGRLQALFFPEAVMLGGPYLPVDRERMKIADADRIGRTCSSNEGRGGKGHQAAGGSGLEQVSSVQRHEILPFCAAVIVFFGVVRMLL